MVETIKINSSIKISYIIKITFYINSQNTNDFIWGANDSLTVLGNASVTADSYTQNGAIDVVGVLTINVESDFDYVADFDGTIDFNSLNLNVGGDFSNNDASSDFTWGANDVLTVLGSASVTTDNYIQSGAIDVAGALTINANNYTYDRPNSDFVLGENDSLSISGDFIIDTNNYIQFGTLVVDGALTIESDRDFSNSGNITSVGYIKTCCIVCSGRVIVCYNIQSSYSNISCICYFTSRYNTQIIYINIPTC